jgi:intracellular multiplication protein IcmB
MISFFDEVLAATLMAIHQPISSFIQLETADDDVTLVAADGSLVSFVKLYGSRQIIGDAEYQWIIDQATIKLGARFDRPGYAMQFYFMRDSFTVTQDIDRVMRGNRSAARALELDVEDLLN